MASQVFCHPSLPDCLETEFLIKSEAGCLGQVLASSYFPMLRLQACAACLALYVDAWDSNSDP